jgi:putative hydrolase of the HAD superfamily
MSIAHIRKWGGSKIVRMIRAVFFDLDGTLYDRDAAILRMAEEQFEAFREELGVDKPIFMERLMALDGHGHNRTPRLHHALADMLGFRADLADDLEACFRSRYPNQCRISQDSLNTLETLRANGKKLGIITNGPTRWQSRKIECLGIASLFDTILISETEGIEKPDPRIFTRALDRCDVLACESIFVGDHPEVDIGGAKRTGLRPVWKRVPYWEVPNDVPKIDQLSEILALTL